ncbi:hypothetical protein HHL28_10770 [Aerophototrophica crusticola]|uniref:Spore coat protein U domain-containing protein n=1 Tax=Aerophototrophica crusticola TaxID=1709002 RepID=A0A858R7F5_9PROT|nr:hypothetical protein HHL28_10770 [Rhodospirillaceae bacterium B3]
MCPRRGPGRLTLAILALPALCAAPAAAQGTGSLRLGALVQAECALQVMENLTVLDVLGGVRDVPIATVGERCNDGDGYRVVLTSRNNGFLRGQNGDVLSYLVSYGPLEAAKLSAPEPSSPTMPRPIGSSAR